MTAKKCTKKRDARAKLLFCESKPIDFLPFSLTSPSSLLKLPYVTKNDNVQTVKMPNLFLTSCIVFFTKGLIRVNKYEQTVCNVQAFFFLLSAGKAEMFSGIMIKIRIVIRLRLNFL